MDNDSTAPQPPVLVRLPENRFAPGRSVAGCLDEKIGRVAAWPAAR
jgi:hypothetical protein